MESEIEIAFRAGYLKALKDMEKQLVESMANRKLEEIFEHGNNQFGSKEDTPGSNRRRDD